MNPAAPSRVIVDLMKPPGAVDLAFLLEMANSALEVCREDLEGARVRFEGATARVEGGGEGAVERFEAARGEVEGMEREIGVLGDDVSACCFWCWGVFGRWRLTYRGRFCGWRGGLR